MNYEPNALRRSRHLQRSLDMMQGDLLSLFGIVEQMIHKSVRALYERDRALADEVINSDPIVDQREVVVEDECLNLLALHQPVAGDLRWVTTVIKVNNDLERIADLACNIARRVQSLTEYPTFPIPDDFKSMVTQATGMVNTALNAFVEVDVAQAKKVIQSDDQIDDLNRLLIDQLRSTMKSDAQSIDPALHCFSVVRILERIADLAVNIAEDVIFLADGKIVRHRAGDMVLDSEQ